MGFNLTVIVVWRFLAFCFGVGTAGLVLLAANYLVPGAWLPIVLAGAFAALAFGHRWLAETRLAGWIASSLSFGVCAGWLESDTHAIRGVAISKTPTLIFAALCVASFLTLVAKIWKSPTKQRAPGWFLVVLILMVWGVSIGSSSAGSASGTEHLLQMIGFTRHDAQALVPYVRKTIHFSFYGLMGWLGYRAATAGGEKPPEAWRFALLLTFLVAAFDETRQAYIPGRGPSVYDVLLDLSGAVTFIAVFSFRASRKKLRRKLST